MPQKIVKFQALKCDFQHSVDQICGLKSVFFIEENVAFNLSVTQSIPTSNEQMMKTKLHTFARKQILRKPIKKLVKK